MLKKIFGLGLAILALVAIGQARPAALEVDIGFFYDQLSPYGEWVAMQPYGWVWCPSDIGYGWRPYEDGYWADSDDGWVFISPVDWGWACYHYGRWAFDVEYGWYWVPDTIWGPAWVAWRWGGGYCGWAPLPPQVGFSFGVGLEWGGFDVDRGYDYSAWTFVEASRITDPEMRRYVVNSGRNVTLLRETRNVTNYRVEGGRIVNNSVDVGQIERLTGRPVPRYKISESTAEKGRAARISGDQLEVFRPQIRSGKTSVEPKNTRPAVNPQELKAKQKKEQEQLNSHYQGRMDELKKQQAQEKANQAKGASQQEMNKRHQEETKALDAQKKKDTQVQANKHKREQQAASGQSKKQPEKKSEPAKKQEKKKKGE